MQKSIRKKNQIFLANLIFDKIKIENFSNASELG